MSGSFRAEPILTRTEVFEQIREALQCLESNNVLEHSIINLHGVTGLGKTRFIESLYDHFSQTYPSIFLSFPSPDTTKQAEALTPWRELRNMLRETLPALEQLAHTITLTKGGTLSLDHEYVLVKFTKLDSTVQHKPLLLILDDLDNVSYWKWLQGEIIKPLVERHKTLILCTSQSPLFWHFWELRERCLTEGLAPLSFDESKASLSKQGYKVLTGTFYNLTHGYALSHDHLVKFLESGKLTDEDKEQKPLIDVDRLSAQTREILDYVSVLRQIEMGVLVALLNEFVPDWSHQPKKALRADVFPELTINGYLEPLTSSKPLGRIVQPVQEKIQAALRAERPELYLALCQFLEQTYYKRIRERPLTDPVAFNEWLYFSTLLVEHDAYDRNEWLQQTQKLFEKVRRGGTKVVAALYRDIELRNQLRRVGLEDDLYTLIDQFFKPNETVPLLGPKERTDYPQIIMNRFMDRLPKPEIAEITAGLPVDFEGLLELIFTIGPEFDPLSLRSRLNELNEGADIKHGPVNNTIAILNSLGVITYERERRKYRLNPVIRTLVAR